jgi:hemerythrin-like domain-containing protein
MEEDYIFPLFEKHHKDLKLIATLKEQHIKGREITAELEKTIQSSIHEDNHAMQLKIRRLLEEFIAMYRPHEAREDTEIFPMVRSFLTEKEFEELSEKIETFEHQLLGHDGLEKIMKKIRSIEKDLGIKFL